MEKRSEWEAVKIGDGGHPAKLVPIYAIRAGMGTVAEYLLEDVAKQIVRDHNSRDALVAALKGALQFMEANAINADQPKPGTYSGDRIIAARAALAQAEQS